MARKLRAQLELDTAQARRNTRQVTDEVNKFGDAAKRQMGAAEQATAGFVRQIVALGASYVSLQGLLSVIRNIVGAMENAVRLRMQFAEMAVDVQRTVAGAASQFRVSEPAMGEFVGAIGKQVGAAPGDLAGITASITGAASAGLIGDVTMRGGALAVSPADRQKLALINQFAQYTGQPAQASDIASLVAKAFPGRAPGDISAGAVRGVLGQMVGAYRASDLSDWADFTTGLKAGGATFLAQGIGFETVTSNYAALAAMERSGVRAGETFRMIGERYFTADDPKMISLIDRIHGTGTYWRLKQSDPTALFNLIVGTLTELEGPEAARRFDVLEMPPEQRGRLAKLRAARGRIGGMLTSMREGPETIGQELVDWRAGPRARAQAADLEAAFVGISEGGKSADVRALMPIAEAARDFWRARTPTMQEYREWFRPETSEKEEALVQWLLWQQEGERWGFGYPLPFRIELEGDDPRFRVYRRGATGLTSGYEDVTESQFYREFPWTRRFLAPGTTTQPSIHINTLFNNTPNELADNEVRRMP